MLPNVMFIGPLKTGTTWVDDYLRARGDVALPVLTKETFFFDKLFDRGIEWYENQFPRGHSQERICVEVAPSLFHKPEAAERLAKLLPDASVVVILRDPVDRAVSHYFHYLKAGEQAVSFAEMARLRPDVLEPGFGFRHLSHWRRLLGPRRVRVLQYDEMKRNPAGFADEVASILGLASMPPPPCLVNSNVASVPLSPRIARFARIGADWMRRMGGHRIVNAFKNATLMEAVYGPPVDAVRKNAVRREAEAFRHLFEADQARLAALLRELDPVVQD